MGNILDKLLKFENLTIIQKNIKKKENNKLVNMIMQFCNWKITLKKFTGTSVLTPAVRIIEQIESKFVDFIKGIEWSMVLERCSVTTISFTTKLKQKKGRVEAP